MQTHRELPDELSVRRVTAARDLEKMTDWMYGWWGEQEGYRREAVRCYLEHSLQTERLPQTFGLYLGEELIGMYQFTNEDLFPRPDIYPWLANVYIESGHRHEGYGSFLLSTVRENAAANLASPELFLFTVHEGLYEHFGWELAEVIDTFLEPRLQRLYRLKLR